MVVLPNQVALVALVWFLEHKAQSGIVAFMLQTTEAPSPASVPDAAALPNTDTVEGVVGLTRERLG